MKKLPLIFFTILYLISGSAFPIIAHYCKGKLTSVSISISEFEPCQCGIKKVKKKCCQNKQIKLKKTQTDQASSQFTPDFKLSHSQIFEHTTTIFTLKNCHSNDRLVYNQHPPNSEPPPLFILNRVFRI